jgi:diacylglycerol kinase family enzyme
MQATLIYNQSAGSNGKISAEELQEALREIGYHPVYQATSSQEDLDSILAEPQGLVVVAGGDGSLRAVATRLIGKQVPISVIPLGTANNICRSLGIEGSPQDIIAGLKNPRKSFFDVGYARSPWGSDYFLEGLGYGYYADILAAYDPNKGKSIWRSLEAILETLPNYEPYYSQLKIDGELVSGDFLLVEVLNTTAIGPRLKLAPEADPTDGLFQVVCLREDSRDTYLSYLTSLLTDGFHELPSVEVKQARRLEITWTGCPIHVDGEVRPEESQRPADWNPAQGARPLNSSQSEAIIEVKILAGALEFWLPQPSG